MKGTTGVDKVLEIPRKLLAIEGIEEVYKYNRTKRSKAKVKKLKDFLTNKLWEKQDFFKFNGLSWRVITNYYNSVSTTKTSGPLRLLVREVTNEVYIRDPRSNKDSKLSIVRPYNSLNPDYDLEISSLEMKSIKDNEKSMFDVGRFQVMAACNVPQAKKFYFYSDMVAKTNRAGHGEPFKGYYVICGTHMSFERCYQALKEYYKENHRNPDEEHTTFFHLDILSVHRDIFEEEAMEDLQPHEKDFLLTEFHKAIASFDKVLVVLDCWKNPTTFLSTFAIWQLYALVEYNVDFDIVVQRTEPVSPNGSNIVFDRKMIYAMQSEVPQECMLYPLQFGNGDPSSSDSVRSIYQLLEDEDFSTYGHKDIYFTTLLEEVFQENGINFQVVKQKVLKKLKKAIARHVCDHIVSGILKKFERNRSFLDLEGKLRKCAPLLHQLGETRLAIGLCTHICKLTQELNANHGVSKLKCNLEFDKLQFEFEQSKRKKLFSHQELEQPINAYRVDRFMYHLMSKVTLGNYIHFKEVIREKFTATLLNALNRENSRVDLNQPESYKLMLEALFLQIKSEKTHALKNISFEEISNVLDSREIEAEEPDGMVLFRKILFSIYATPASEGKALLVLKQQFYAVLRTIDFRRVEDYAGKRYFVCLVHVALLRKCNTSNLADHIHEEDFRALTENVKRLDRRQNHCCIVELILLKARWHLQLREVEEARLSLDELKKLEKGFLKRYQIGKQLLRTQVLEIERLMGSIVTPT